MMNVNDVQEVQQTKGCRLEAIFNKQHELQEEYSQIELHKGIGYGIINQDFDLDCHKTQYLIKDYFWRTTEELAEAAEALVEYGSFTHGIEELADALHFLVEACLISGYHAIDICPWRHSSQTEDRLDIIWKGLPICVITQGQCLSIDDINELGARIIWSMGLAANCLKNKPWKTTQVLTDRNKFKLCITKAVYALFELIKACGLNPQETYQIYMEKSEVNKFRIRSGY
jgi:hypothetical protein